MARKRSPLDDPNLIICDGPSVIGNVKLADGKTYPLREMNVGEFVKMGKLNANAGGFPDDELLPFYIEIAAAVTGAEPVVFDAMSSKQVIRVCAMSQYGIAAVLKAEAAQSDVPSAA